jgi:hypothetical protein
MPMMLEIILAFLDLSGRYSRGVPSAGPHSRAGFYVQRNFGITVAGVALLSIAHVVCGVIDSGLA